MKTLRFAFKTLLVVTTISLVFTSCKKKQTEDNDTSSSTDNAFAEASYNDMGTIADQASTGSTTSYRMSNGDDGSLLSACATITMDTMNHLDADTLIIDFGTTNCMCADGRNRRGIINVVYTGVSFPVHYRDSGMTANFSTNNYFVNDNQIAGTKTVHNLGWNLAHHLTWSVTVNGTIYLANNGGTVTWNANKTKELLAGQAYHGAPITWGTAKVGITGSANGTAADGHSFSANVTTQLVRDFSCVANRRHFVSGNLDFTPDNKPTRHIDFGSGACDDIATVTIGTHVYTVHMH